MRIIALLLVALPLWAQPKSPGPLPPIGKPLPAHEREELEAAVGALEKDVATLRRDNDASAVKHWPDVQIYVNAVRYPLRYNEPVDYKKAKAALAAGVQRAKQLREHKVPWLLESGPRGYVSKIDGSVQPYLIAIPTNYKPDHKWRLDFFCHGRGETLLELTFLNTKPGEAKDRFYVQPYGRYCCANKFAGEIDILEVLDAVKAQYAIDEDRVILTGFSMGGAAVWHLAVHYPDLWCAASPGAGFAETEAYQKMDKTGELAAMPAYQRALMHWYDATDYALNLFNLPLIAYAGTEDPQQQSGDVMAQAAAEFGIKLQRIYGQGVGHKYEPKAKAELDRRLTAYAEKGLDHSPSKVKFETWTLRYNHMHWVAVEGLEHHWQRATVEASQEGDTIRAKTANVSAIAFTRPIGTRKVELDATTLPVDPSGTLHFQKTNGSWKPATDDDDLRKSHGLQGPIDDAFLDSFLFVKPTGQPLNPKVAAWAESEMSHAVRQWHNIFRGEAPVKNDSDITDADIASNNLILWGDPSSNKILARIADRLPIRWSRDGVTTGKKKFDAATHVPILIYPNPLNPKHYVVINSGFTFREDANGTNSRQIPRLPDYAVIDVKTSPDTHYPGKVVKAGFFGERWELPE